jgi:hypothetical protein
MNNHIFYIAGGMGKNIIATSVIRSLKQLFPNDKIIIVSPYSVIWQNNPDVFDIELPENTPLVYEKYIKEKNSKVYRLEPYSSEDYFYQRKSLIQIWCDLYKIPCTNLQPYIYLTEEEINVVKNKITNIVGDKKIFLIQTNGGAENQNYPISWSRDLPLPIADIVCKQMNDRGYFSIHLKRQNQLTLKNAISLDLSVRQSMCLIALSDKRLFIDSFAQHAAAALNKKSVVTWVSNTPKVFGYDLHTNILPIASKDFRHNIDSFLEQYNITGNIHECPYSTNLIYSTDEILNKLLE